MAANGKDITELWNDYFKDKSLETRNLLVCHYYDLCSKIAWSLTSKFQDVEDATAYGVCGLISAIETFDPVKAKFNTYAQLKITGAILDQYRKENGRKNKRTKTVSYYSEGIDGNNEEVFTFEAKTPPPINNLLIEEIWEPYSRIMTTEEYKVFILYWREDLSQADIAEETGLTESQVTYLLKGIHNQIGMTTKRRLKYRKNNRSRNNKIYGNKRRSFKDNKET